MDANVLSEELEANLELGSGWIEYFESGEYDLMLDDVAQIVKALDGDVNSFLQSVNVPVVAAPANLNRSFRYRMQGESLCVEFPYGPHTASYHIDRANTDQLAAVIGTLRDGLAVEAIDQDAGAIKARAVADCFLAAVRQWPDANPSDLWYFIVYRAFLDRYNHPPSFASLDLGQSWKRTGGWALEQVLVEHYGPYLEEQGILIMLNRGQESNQLIEQMDTDHRLEPDKVDVLLVGRDEQVEVCFGIIHVKSSFAERRTDDVPLSQALVRAGYVSPLWTMDAKAFPSVRPVNKGELGRPMLPGYPDRRSAKRKDIEVDGYFSACFSYNHRTIETPQELCDAKARVFVCDFGNPDDEFSRFVIKAWTQFRKRLTSD